MARHNGRAQQELASRFNRAAQEEVATLGGRGCGGGAALLDAAALQSAVEAAVQAAIGRIRPAAVEGEGGEAAPATAQQLKDVVTELRTMITNVASPAPQATVVVRKTKRYELGQSTSREKARRLPPTC